MKLYWGSGSPVSWRVQIALALKHIEYDSHRLDLGAREHRSDAYRLLNPTGTFPLLVDGDIIVRDSIAILAFLERHTPAPPLFGASLSEAAYIWQHVVEHEQNLGSHADMLTRALFRDGGLDDPEPARAAVSAMEAQLKLLEQQLQHSDWLCSNAPCALEVVNYPTLHRILRAAGKSGAAQIGLERAPFAQHYPAVQEWLERVQALPGIVATYPPHWR
jgi:glutathione S-transferase